MTTQFRIQEIFKSMSNDRTVPFDKKQTTNQNKMVDYEGTCNIPLQVRGVRMIGTHKNRKIINCLTVLCVE